MTNDNCTSYIKVNRKKKYKSTNVAFNVNQGSEKNLKTKFPEFFLDFTIK